MTNEQRQKSIESKMKREDLGTMPCCYFCEKRFAAVNIEQWGCWATQEERRNHCLCAKAHNRMVRNKREKVDY